MTLLTGHELATALATAAALLAVLTGGQVEPVCWAAVALIPLAWWMRLRGWGLPTKVGGALALGAVAFGVVFTVRAGLPSILLGAAYALFLLVCVRLLNRETPAHDLQLYALSLLLVLDAAALNTSWLYAPCFLVYTISIVWALTTRELKRAAQDDHQARHGQGDAPLWHEPRLLRGRFFAATAAIAVVVLIGTLSLFVVFPRVGLGILRLAGAQKSSGFSTSVTLGGGGSISSDSSVVMRVRPVDDGDLPLNLYFRGAALDHYDGTSWSRSDLERGVPPGAAQARMPKPIAKLRRYRVSLEPMDIPFLFTAGAVKRVSVEPGPRIFTAPPVPVRDGFGDMVLPFPAHEVVNYEVEADLELPPLPASVGEPTPPLPDAYTSLDGVDERIQALAREWSAGEVEPARKVQAIAARLRMFAYTVEDEFPPLGVGALEHFLFTRKAGHCEYFATALAVMSRSIGVPARIVGGYQGGARHPSGEYLVLRQSDAHAWTEIYLPPVGWMAVDATPNHALNRPPMTTLASLTESLQRLWEDYVIDFDLGVQVQAAQGVAGMLSSLRSWRPDGAFGGRRTLAIIGGALLLVALALLAWRQRGKLVRRSEPGQRLAVALEDVARRVSGTAPSNATAREWMDATLPHLTHEEARLLSEASERYERCRFGGEDLDLHDEMRMVQALRRVAAPPQQRSSLAA